MNCKFKISLTLFCFIGLFFSCNKYRPSRLSHTYIGKVDSTFWTVGPPNETLNWRTNLKIERENNILLFDDGWILNADSLDESGNYIEVLNQKIRTIKFVDDSVYYYTFFGSLDSGYSSLFYGKRK